MLHLSTLKYYTSLLGHRVLKIEGVFYAQPDGKLSKGLSRYEYVDQVGHVKRLVGTPVIDTTKLALPMYDLAFRCSYFSIYAVK